MCMSNNRAVKYMKPKLIGLKEEIDKSKIIVEDITVFSTNARTTKQQNQ